MAPSGYNGNTSVNERIQNRTVTLLFESVGAMKMNVSMSVYVCGVV